MLSEVLDQVKDPEFREAFLAMPAQKQAATLWRMGWMATRHDHQIMPHGDWWTIWLLLAGRGAGKTRTAAEQVGWWAWENPNTRWLISAPTSADVRGTCFEGDSGLLSIIPDICIADYNKALHELKLVNGSFIKGIPASEPERYRGPQFHGAWFDELAAFDYIDDAYDGAQFTLRLTHPDIKRVQQIITTTPRPKELIVDLSEGKIGGDV